MILKPSFFTVMPFASVLQKHEAELVARNIMLILARTGDAFRAIEWDEYLSERNADGAKFAELEKPFFEQVSYLALPENNHMIPAFSPDWAKAAEESQL